MSTMAAEGNESKRRAANRKSQDKIRRTQRLRVSESPTSVSFTALGQAEALKAAQKARDDVPWMYCDST